MFVEIHACGKESLSVVAVVSNRDFRMIRTSKNQSESVERHFPISTTVSLKNELVIFRAKLIDDGAKSRRRGARGPIINVHDKQYYRHCLILFPLSYMYGGYVLND